MTKHAVNTNEDIDPAVAKLAAEIRQRRIVADLSHAQLAHRIGYSRQYVSMAERARKGLPSAGLVSALDRELNAHGELIDLRDKAHAARQARHSAASPPAIKSSGLPAAIGAASIELIPQESGLDELAVQTPPGRFFAGATIPARAFPASDDGRIIASVPRGGLARRRRAVGHTQESLAAEVRVDRSTVVNWEAGKTEPQPWHRPKLAAALDITLGELDKLLSGDDAVRQDVPLSIPVPSSKPTLEVGAVPGITAVRRLVDVYDLPDDGPLLPMPRLEQATTAVVRARLNSGYSYLLRTLPELVPALTRALFYSSGTKRAAVAGLLVQAYRAADAIADKVGLYDLSARVIHVMRWAAEQSEDPLLLATTSYVRAETFFASGQLDAGRRMLEQAAESVTARSSMEAAAAYGALHMRAAITAARARQTDRAHEHLSEAHNAAARVEEGVYYGTAFGPGSVRIHEVTLAVDMDDPDRALAAATRWAPPDVLPAERRSHYYVDLARAKLLTNRYEAALNALGTAQTIAPEHIRVHPDVHAMLIPLAEAGQGRRAAVENFAARAGISLAVSD